MGDGLRISSTLPLDVSQGTIKCSIGASQGFRAAFSSKLQTQFCFLPSLNRSQDVGVTFSHLGHTVFRSPLRLLLFIKLTTTRVVNIQICKLVHAFSIYIMLICVLKYIIHMCYLMRYDVFNLNSFGPAPVRNYSRRQSGGHYGPSELLKNRKIFGSTRDLVFNTI